MISLCSVAGVGEGWTVAPRIRRASRWALATSSSRSTAPSAKRALRCRWFRGPPCLKVNDRSEGGRHEIDIVIETAEGVLGVEAKLGAVPGLSERLGGDLLDAIVITTGTEAFRRRDGVGVIPLALLGP